MTIGYLAQVFPRISETFVYREVQALREAHFAVQTFATWRPDPAALSEEAKALVDHTFYIFPLNWPKFFLSHLNYLFTRPRNYVATFLFFITREHKTFKNRVRTLLHFCEAVYLAREVERRGIKHLHVHFALNATTIAMVINKLTGISFSFTAHANDIFVNPILLPEKIALAKFIIAISDYNINLLKQIANSQDLAHKIHLVHCGIDVAHFAPPTHRPEGEPPLILSVGRLIEKKGFSVLIKACRILADQGHTFKCLIAGDGPQEAMLQQMITDSALHDHVELLGIIFQEDLKRYISQASLFVLPCVVGQDNDMDGIPNSLMEAMAMETPVISTTLSGIPELVQDGETGLLAPPGDAVALAEAMAQLLQDKKYRLILGSQGREKVMTEFEITKNVDKLLTIFHSYLTLDVDRNMGKDLSIENQ